MNFTFFSLLFLMRLQKFTRTHVACILFLSDSAGLECRSGTKGVILTGRRFGLMVRKELLTIGQGQRREAGAPCQ